MSYQYRQSNISKVKIESSNMITANFSSKDEFINGTGEYLYITRRDGVCVRVPPDLSRPDIEGDFYVDRLYEWSKGVDISLNRRELVEVIRANSFPHIGGMTKSMIRFSVAKDYIDKGDIYISDLDIVISKSNGKNHPASEEAAISEIEKKKATMDIFIVANNEVVGSRWAAICGAVQKIKVISDYRLKNGVYLHREDSESGGAVQFNSLQDHEKGIVEPQLFTSKEAAKDSMRVASEEELNILKGKMEEEKTKNQLLLAEKAKELAMLENRLKEKSMVSKDTYEERSYSRKDSNEFLKSIPVVATAAIGIVALAGKFLR